VYRSKSYGTKAPFLASRVEKNPQKILAWEALIHSLWICYAKVMDNLGN